MRRSKHAISTHDTLARTPRGQRRAAASALATTHGWLLPHHSHIATATTAAATTTIAAATATATKTTTRHSKSSSSSE